jgi:hypothetical protein
MGIARKRARGRRGGRASRRQFEYTEGTAEGVAEPDRTARSIAAAKTKGTAGGVIGLTVRGGSCRPV